MITVLGNKNTATNTDLWFSDNKKSQENTSQNISDGVYHRPKGTIPTMNRYGMFADNYKPISIDSEKNASNIPLALSYDSIDDYKKIPQAVFIDWKLIISMNDNPGHYHNFINPEKRSKIINHIRQWRIANNY